MALANTRSGWGSLTKLLHWTIALLILGTAIFVLHINGSTWWFTSGPAIYIKYIQWHKAAGLIALALILVRVFWRRSQVVPQTAPLTPFEKLWSHRVHIAIYGFMLAVPLSGWMASSFFGSPTKFWGLFTIPSPLPKWKTGVAIGYWAHFLLAWSLLILVGGHIAAALYHHFIRRDRTLVAMLPGGNLPGETTAP